MNNENGTRADAHLHNPQRPMVAWRGQLSRTYNVYMPKPGRFNVSAILDDGGKPETTCVALIVFRVQRGRDEHPVARLAISSGGTGGIWVSQRKGRFSCASIAFCMIDTVDLLRFWI